VCVDCREPGGVDLADKELAVLLQEVGLRGPHIAVLLDCCHSGSATRGADDFTQARARFTHAIDAERPLETYLDGYFADRLARGGSLEIPASRHILLAACERVQKAWESKDHCGVFTSTLLDVLGQAGTGIDYADLFLRARAVVRRYADDQTPQFETYVGFNAYSSFLGTAAAGQGQRFRVSFDQGAWKANCGALHGLPTDPERMVELALYREADPGVLAGHAQTTQVGAQVSEVRLLDLAATEEDRLQAQVSSLPVPPLPVRLTGDLDGIAAVQAAFAAAADQRASGFAFSTDTAGDSAYCLAAEGGRLRLSETRTGRLIQAAESNAAAMADHLFTALKSIAAWERAVALQNQATRMDRQSVEFQFVEVLADGTEHPYPGEAVTIDIPPDSAPGGTGWQAITARLRANNRSAQPLHFALAYLSNAFGIQVA
jgi:hypothetical protein